MEADASECACVQQRCAQESHTHGCTGMYTHSGMDSYTHESVLCVLSEWAHFKLDYEKIKMNTSKPVTEKNYS